MLAIIFFCRVFRLFPKLFVTLQSREKWTSMKYNQEEIPKSWKYCFNGGCPRRHECLRFQTGLELPDEQLFGSAIFPTALKDGDCAFFRRDEKVRLATGFVIPGNRRMSDIFVALRRQVSNYLGHGGTYYLYRNGQRWLTPEQQAAIAHIVRVNGYDDEVVFAEYKEDYNFT